MSINDRKYVERLEKAINWIGGDEIKDEEIRATVRRALSVELNKYRDIIEEEERYGRQKKPWTKEDIEILKDTLTGLVAESWEQAQVNIEMASRRLSRLEKSVKGKAIELGYGKAVDYRYATGERRAPVLRPVQIIHVGDDDRVGPQGLLVNFFDGIGG